MVTDINPIVTPLPPAEAEKALKRMCAPYAVYINRDTPETTKRLKEYVNKLEESVQLCKKQLIYLNEANTLLESTSAKLESTRKALAECRNEKENQ